MWVLKREGEDGPFNSNVVVHPSGGGKQWAEPAALVGVKHSLSPRVHTHTEPARATLRKTGWPAPRELLDGPRRGSLHR